MGEKDVGRLSSFRTSHRSHIGLEGLEAWMYTSFHAVTHRMDGMMNGRIDGRMDGQRAPACVGIEAIASHGATTSCAVMHWPAHAKAAVLHMATCFSCVRFVFRLAPARRCKSD